jgi:hypothetical protein
MFQNRLHGDYLHWYLKSSHKDRIDLIGESLISKNYKFAVVQNHLLEWIRLSRYLSENNFSLPSNIFIEEIQEYMKIRFPEVAKHVDVGFVRLYGFSWKLITWVIFFDV